MEANSIISEGFTLLILGMGFVFLFLALLVLATNLMSKLIIRFSAHEPISTPSTSSAQATVNLDPNVLTAIRTAIQMHRENNH